MKRPTLLLMLLIWGASLTAAYLIGRQTSPLPAESSRVENTSIEKEAEAAIPVKNGEKAIAEATVEASPTPQFSALTLENSLQRLNTLSPEQLEALVAQAMALPDSDPKRRRSIESLLARLAETSPLRALELADQIGALRATEDARERILEVWASNDPLAALRWSEEGLSQLPISSRHDQMQALLRGYASHDPAAAFDYVAALEEGTRIDSRIKSSLMEEVIEVQIREGGLVEARGSIQALPEGRLKQEMMREMVDEWAGFDPVGAAEYVASLGADATPDLKTTIASEWAESDPAAAAKWLDSFPPDDPALPRATAEVIREWTRYDLDAPAEWLNTLPASEDLDRAVASYTYRAAQEDPAGAMSWAESIVDERLRSRMMESVAVSWKETDPGGFTTYLESAEIAPEQRQSLQAAEPRDRGDWRFRRR